MFIRVKLMGVLKTATPPGGRVEVPVDATIAAALEGLGLDAHQVGVCSVNGRLVRDRTHVLSADDELLVVPPVGGG